MPQADTRSFEQKLSDNKARIAEKNRLAHVAAAERRKAAQAMSARLRRGLDPGAR
jgi:hypothetical protein